MPKVTPSPKRQPKDAMTRAKRDEARERFRQKRRETKSNQNGEASRAPSAAANTAPKDSSLSASGLKKPSRSTIAGDGNKKRKSKKRKSDEPAGGETGAKKAKLVEEAAVAVPEIDAEVQEHHEESACAESTAQPPVETAEKVDSCVDPASIIELGEEEEVQIIEQVSNPVPLKPLPRPAEAPSKLEFESSGPTSALSRFRAWEASYRKAGRKYDQRNRDIRKQEAEKGSPSNEEQSKPKAARLESLKEVTLSEFFNPGSTTIDKYEQFWLDVSAMARYMKDRKEGYHLRFNIRIGVNEKDSVFPQQYLAYLKAVRGLIIDLPTRVSATVDIGQLNEKMAPIETEVATYRELVRDHHAQKEAFQQEVEASLHPPETTVDAWHLRDPKWWDTIREYDKKYACCQHVADIRKLVQEIEDFNSKDDAGKIQLAQALRDAEKGKAREKSRLKGSGTRRSSAAKSSSTTTTPTNPAQRARSSIASIAEAPTPTIASPALPDTGNDNEEAIEDEEGESGDEDWMLEMDREIEAKRGTG